MNIVKLLNGREKSVLRRHPWIFSGAIANITGNPVPGETVKVVNSKNEPIALAAFSPESQITARVWTFNCDEEINEDFFRSRITRAIQLREKLGYNTPNCGCRLIFSESDGLPGLIADKYADYIVIQISSAGIEFHKDTIIKVLMESTNVRGIFERSDLGIRKREGLPERQGLLAGAEPPKAISISEHSFHYAVDMRHGQKTGFYFDLGTARKRFVSLAKGRVLNTFSYTGAFAVCALSSKADYVLNIDSSRHALDQASKNLELNNISSDRYENRCCDVFDELKKLKESGELFDTIILDPPKLIENKGQVDRGCRAYQFLARHGFSMLKPGGIMLNFSCSGLMTPDLFQKITAAAAIEANTDAAIVEHLEQAPDHPVLLSVPETAYLKGLVSVKY